MTFSSFIDNSFFLNSPNIGLFQHPSIWTFFLIQALVPFSLQQSTKRFLRMPHWKNSIIHKKYFDQQFDKETKIFINDIKRKTLISKSIFISLFTFGLISFIWNTYQNQAPIKFLGFDFWDSYNYPFGYWATRVYKFYIWCLFLPSVIHAYLFVIIRTLSVLNKSYSLKLLSVEPYHFDNNGGVSVFLKNIVNPTIPVLFITSLLSIFVFVIHEKFDLTSIASLIIASCFLLIFYFIPAIKIRKIIKKDKQRQLAEIAQKQKKILNEIITIESSDEMKNKFELISTLQEISNKIKSVPNWPNHKFILKILTIAYSPTVFNVLIKIMLPLLNDK